MIRFHKKQLSTLIIGLLVIASLSAIFYYSFILKTEKRNNQLHEQLLSIQNEKLTDEVSTEDRGDELLSLTQKVPVTSSEEQIILDLEEAALGSDSVIVSLGFNEYSPGSDEKLSESETAEDYISEMSPDAESNERMKFSLPNGLRQIQIGLTVRSKDYVALTGFLENIRKLPRIYVVDSFSFNGFEENETKPGPFEDELEYTVQLVSYYAPMIKEYASKSGIVLPDPADKENPLHDVKEEKPDIMDGWKENEPGLGMTLEEFLALIRQNQNEGDHSLTEGEILPPADPSSDKESSSAPDSSTEETTRQYKVQRGDTLFSISMKYYGNREGEALIKEANHKRSDIVIVGETLIIP